MRTTLLHTAAFAIAGLAYATAATAADKNAVPASTPEGLTLVDVTSAADKFLWRRLGDATGNPLYFYDRDETTGKSSCVDACAKEFPPQLAPANAVASGDWSVVARADGTKQWAYQGRPLYRYSGKDPSGAKPTRRSGRAAGVDPLSDPASSVNSPKEGWRRAGFTPEATIPTPSGIELQSLAVANGYGFISSANQMVTYVLKTPPKNTAQWSPVYAPAVARPIGEFSIVTREDGTSQWAFRGQRLYTFSGDYSNTDLNGILAEKDAKPALAIEHYTPPAVAVEILPYRGPVMTNTKGLSLYTVSRYKLQYGGRHARDGYHASYAMAKLVGTRGCTDDCLKDYRPFIAPANAQPSGFWEVLARADGSKQWAYKGSALYTYAGDKKPGDIQGNNRHEVMYGDAEGKRDLSVTGGDDAAAARENAGSGLYWHLVTFFN